MSYTSGSWRDSYQEKFRVTPEFFKAVVSRHPAFQGRSTIGAKGDEFFARDSLVLPGPRVISKASDLRENHEYKVKRTNMRLNLTSSSSPMAVRSLAAWQTGPWCIIDDWEGFLVSSIIEKPLASESSVSVTDEQAETTYSSIRPSSLKSQLHHTGSTVEFFQDYPQVPNGFRRPAAYFSTHMSFQTGVTKIGGHYRSSLDFQEHVNHLQVQTLVAALIGIAPVNLYPDSDGYSLVERTVRKFKTRTALREGLKYETVDRFYPTDRLIIISNKEHKPFVPAYKAVYRSGVLSHYTRDSSYDLAVAVYISGRQTTYEYTNTFVETCTDLSVSPLFRRASASPRWFSANPYSDLAVHTDYIEHMELDNDGSFLQLMDKTFNISGEYTPPKSKWVADYVDFFDEIGLLPKTTLHEHFDECRQRAYARSSMTTFNGIVTAAGLRQTTKMLHDRLRQVLSLVKIILSGKLHQLPSRFKPNRKTFSKGFLEWNFGWQQLFEDIAEIKRLYESQDAWTKESNWSKGSHETDTYTLGSWSKSDKLLNLPQGVSKCVSTLRLDFGVHYDSDALIAASGFETPAFAIWDMVPLTWVIDLLSPIGTWLKAVEMAQTVKPISESFTFSILRKRSQTNLPLYIDKEWVHWHHYMSQAGSSNSAIRFNETFKHSKYETPIIDAYDSYITSIRLPVDERFGRLKDLSILLPIRPASDSVSIWSTAAVLSLINNTIPGKR